MKKNKKYKTKKRFVYKYKHKHPLLFFAVIFNIFVFGVIITIHIMNNDLDLISAKQILFNQPNPKILADAQEMLKGYPMEEMAPYIAVEDRQVAAFLIAIAKKESNWGSHTPKLNGKECYNYWGFRRKRIRMGSGGHTCFDSPEEAVKVVSRRIRKLIRKGYNTPAKMVLWKCGNCTGPASTGSAKWIQDVNFYYQQMMNRAD